MYAFRSMTVRNLKGTGPFFHGGSAATVEDVVRYKNTALAEQKVDNLSPLFVPLGLSEQEILDLTAFLSDGLNDPDMGRFGADSVPSGLCVPNDDLQSRFDAACEQFGDFDEDGDVDLDDYERFLDCSNGPDEFPDPTPPTTAADCIAAFDFDNDTDVDFADFGRFDLLFTGN